MRSGVRTRGRPPRRVIVGTLLVVFLAGAGIGGYVIGSSPEVDLEVVRFAATAQGREAGAEEGARKGYARGYRSARNRTYAAAYGAAYEDAYAKEFESAGLDPPDTIRIPDPR
jgi:cystathionine beta-lyase family protein involved in aluminum resistance